MYVCVCCPSVAPGFCAEVVGEEMEPTTSEELDLSGIDDNEIDKVSLH